MPVTRQRPSLSAWAFQFRVGGYPLIARRDEGQQRDSRSRRPTHSGCTSTDDLTLCSCSSGAYSARQIPSMLTCKQAHVTSCLNVVIRAHVTEILRDAGPTVRFFPKYISQTYISDWVLCRVFTSRISRNIRVSTQTSSVSSSAQYHSVDVLK